MPYTLRVGGASYIWIIKTYRICESCEEFQVFLAVMVVITFRKKPCRTSKMSIFFVFERFSKFF